MKLYLYCLAGDFDHAGGSISGISAAPVRWLKLEDVSVMVSDYEGETVPVTREHALVHAAVVRSILDQTTPLPFRFGTIVGEQQLMNFVKTHKSVLTNKLAHVHDCVEMNVKVIYQLPTNENSQANGEPASAGPGTAFLAGKRRQLLADESFSSQRSDFSTLLETTLAGVVREQQIALRPSDTAVLATASHLVRRDQIQPYREKIAKVRENRPELRLLVSGPWPPYSFANIELEFKSQFGVS